MQRLSRLRHFAHALALVATLAVLTVPRPVAAEEEPDDTAAVLLSLLLPGVGEWYNAGFIGGYPIIECITGRLCPCIGLSSIVDAAAGRTDDGIRFDFWASPVSKPEDG